MLCTIVAELPALNIERIFLNNNDHKTIHKQPATVPLNDCEVQLKSVNLKELTEKN